MSYLTTKYKRCFGRLKKYRFFTFSQGDFSGIAVVVCSPGFWCFVPLFERSSKSINIGAGDGFVTKNN